MAGRKYKICLIIGDGIGPEIVKSTVLVLGELGARLGFELEYVEVPGGDSALKQYGDALPQSSVDTFASTDACLKGPFGETVSVINNKLRFGFDLYANIRPARSYPAICPPALRPDIDYVVIRENSEGFYRALENEISPGTWTTTGVFTEKAAERIARFSFSYAKRRRSDKKKESSVTLATKANIFPKTHGLYLRQFEKVAKEFPDVSFHHYYADALCAMLVRDPLRFDVMVSENLIADLLSDLAGQIAGGLGMTPGTNINYENRHAYFEPTHGSAPDIAGKGIANPIGQIRSGLLMLDYLAMVHDDQRLHEAALLGETTIAKLLSSADRSKLPIELGGQAGSAAVTSTIVSLLSASH
jgi:3-isopropylmalate dehydrogenase